MSEQLQGFEPGRHLDKIQGKEYLPVRWRLVWFRQATGNRAGYITVELEHDRQAGFAKHFTIAWDGSDDTWRPVKINGIEVDVCGRVSTGEGSETKADFNEYWEKSATKSLGRALAGLGFGTQFAPELDEKHRVVDTPIHGKERAQRRVMDMASLKGMARSRGILTPEAWAEAWTRASLGAPHDDAGEEERAALQDYLQRLPLPQKVEPAS